MDEKSTDYHDYVIKNGKFIGKFEEMYQNCEDPWHIKNSTTIEYEYTLYIIRRYVEPHQIGAILDIGCGLGAFTYRLSNIFPNAFVRGIDISPTACEKARCRYGTEKTEFSPMNIQETYKDLGEKFDIIVVSQLMWYVLEDFGKIVDSMIENNLNPGGVLVINQAFFQEGEQGYGNEIVEKMEDMLNLIEHKPIETAETNRFVDHNAVILFQNELKIK